jgi:futalosine hydrolase
MTHVLLVSATTLEIGETLDFLARYRSESGEYHFGDLAVTVCITNVGMVNTAFSLGRLEGFKFSVAINAGLAGSFGELPIGEVVSIPEDCFSELGAEDDLNFLRFEDMGFGRQHLSIANRLQLQNTVFTQTSGITVNTVHGNEENIARIKARWNAGVESMEGAAFIHAANYFNWSALQLRAVSNVVEKRDKSRWDIPLALKNLNGALIGILKQLNS